MSHNLLGFVGDELRNAQIRFPIVDEEAFAVVSACRRLVDYLLWEEFSVCCDHCDTVRDVWNVNAIGR